MKQAYAIIHEKQTPVNIDLMNIEIFWSIFYKHSLVFFFS